MERVCVEPPVLLERASGVPLTVQLSSQLREAMRQGRIGPGDRLPSTRALAVALGVSRTVVTDTYAQLYAEGWLEGRHGSGTFVAPGTSGAQPGAGVTGPPAGLAAGPARGTGVNGMPVAPAAVGTMPGAFGGPVGELPWQRWAPVDPPVPSAAPTVINFLPGVPWAGGIDRSAWRRAWRQAAAAELVAAPRPVAEPAGLLELRSVLTGYLRRSRGVAAAPGDIIVTRGVANGLDLIAAALLRPGDAAGIEEPGWPAARAILAARGARVVPCQVDEHGLVVDELPPGLRLIHTTPAHQTPLGGRLPVPRRQALLAWARSSGALIVEDDYDSEFRYDVAPLPALQALDPHVVAYLGTMAKTLTPELSVGWLVAPPSVLERTAQTRHAVSDRTPTAAQQAAANLIREGYLERHVRRMRHEYARRRSAITAMLGALPPPARLLGDTAGLHVVLQLPGAAAAAAATQAHDRGIAVATLDRYFSGPVPPSVDGLVIGYGGATLPQVRRGCEMLCEILEPLLAHGGPAAATGRVPGGQGVPVRVSR